MLKRSDATIIVNPPSSRNSIQPWLNFHPPRFAPILFFHFQTLLRNRNNATRIATTSTSHHFDPFLNLDFRTDPVLLRLTPFIERGGRGHLPFSHDKVS